MPFDTMKDRTAIPEINNNRAAYCRPKVIRKVFAIGNTAIGHLETQLGLTIRRFLQL